VLDRRRLAREAAYEALLCRKKLSIPLEDAVSPIGSAESLDIEVRFVDVPSMEGIYIAGSEPTILLSSLRPSGRRFFTCAHELGHHIFGHGEQFDELRSHRTARRTVDPNEFTADCFAAYFLMPKATVDSGMARRGFRYATITPSEAFSMAGWLGVGYQSFVNQLEYGLGVIDHQRGNILRKATPRGIRAAIIGEGTTGNLYVVDQSWKGRAVDCEVDDYLLLPTSTLYEGQPAKKSDIVAKGLLIQVKHPGIARVSSGRPLWSAFIRVSRRQYVGRSRYRFDEEADE
jgi:hypothetical protein